MAARGAYDPWQHAAELGVHVMTGVLTDARWGEYRDQERTIVMRHGLTERQQRCTLAHELVHAERREHLSDDRVLNARQERRADRLAAQRLIPWQDYVRACRAHGHQKAPVAVELGVTKHLLRAFERDLAEQPHLRARLA